MTKEAEALGTDIILGIRLMTAPVTEGAAELPAWRKNHDRTYLKMAEQETAPSSFEMGFKFDYSCHI